MNEQIGIIGYGALGKQIERFLIEDKGNEFAEFYYFDDILYSQGHKNAFSFNRFDSSDFSDFSFYLGLGYKQLAKRKEICQQLKHNKRRLPSFIHKTAYISPTASVGSAVYVYPMCNVDQVVQLEDGVILNNSATISHDSVVGSCTFIAPGVTVAGNVRIGERCFVGTGSVIANNVTIGEQVTIGIGSNITSDLLPGLSVIGNPFRIVSKNLNL